MMYYIGIDDGYFPLYYKGGRGLTTLVAVGMSGPPLYSIKSILYSFVLVDGLDATEKAIELLHTLGYRKAVVIYDGVTYAGFNFIDPYLVYKATGYPGIVFFRYRVSFERIKKALTKHFPDAKKRLQVIRRVLNNKYVHITPWGESWFVPIGMGAKEAMNVLRKLEVYSPEPEPLRIADMIASSISKYLHERERMKL